MLDLTDNYQRHGRWSTPPGIVRRDGDDPYIVAAADKGTATFSDIANGLSADYGFWLGDAFASGGSAGYDHKGMGITARGAWVMIARHFAGSARPIVQDAPFDLRRRRRHVGRRVRQRAAGSPQDPAASPPSTTATSSSTPIPTRRRPSSERERLFAPAAVLLGGLRRRR